MRFTVPVLFTAAVVSAAPTVKFSDFKLTSTNASTCDACKTLSANADVAAVNKCLQLVPAACTYTATATITGTATVCTAGFGVDLSDITMDLPTAEVTGMKGNLDLKVDGTRTGGCTLDAMVSNTEKCVANPTPKGDLTASLTNGSGPLALTNVKEKYISMKATVASGSTDSCGNKLDTATFNGVTATVSLKGSNAETSTSTPSTTTPASANGVSPVIGGSLLLGLLGALHMI